MPAGRFSGNASDPVAVLRDRLDTLEERFVLLQTSMLPNQHKTWRGLILTPSEQIILSTLSDGAVWEKSRLLARLNSQRPGREDSSSETLYVMLHRLRKKLAVLDPPVSIVSSHRVGYRLSQDGVARLRERIIT